MQTYLQVTLSDKSIQVPPFSQRPKKHFERLRQIGGGFTLQSQLGLSALQVQLHVSISQRAPVYVGLHEQITSLVLTMQIPSNTKYQIVVVITNLQNFTRFNNIVIEINFPRI